MFASTLSSKVSSEIEMWEVIKIKVVDNLDSMIWRERERERELTKCVKVTWMEVDGGDVTTCKLDFSFS